MKLKIFTFISEEAHKQRACTVSFSHLILSTKLKCTYQMVLVYIGWVSCRAGSVCTAKSRSLGWPRKKKYQQYFFTFFGLAIDGHVCNVKWETLIVSRYAWPKERKHAAIDRHQWIFKWYFSLNHWLAGLRVPLNSVHSKWPAYFSRTQCVY